MTEPAVTVLMAVHDGERHLGESVESILRQTYSNFELLVVDDASTDSSPAIVDSFGDRRVRMLANTENLGLTRSLNRGLAEARGRYVARQDADDVSEPHRLERQAEVLDRRPEVALVASHYRRIDDQGRRGGDRLVPTEPLDVRWRLLFLNAFAHSSVMFRRDAVDALGGYDERFRYAQDYDLWSRLALRHPLVAVPEPLVSYRRTLDSLTATYERAGDEISHISDSNLRGLGVDPSRIDRDAAWRLLFAGDRSVEPARAVATAATVVNVQKAFARACGLDVTAARRHAAAVRATLGSQLARLGVERRHPRALARGAFLLASASVARYVRG